MQRERTVKKLEEIEAAKILPAERISADLGALGIPLPLASAKHVQEYITLLLRWNVKIGLTSIVEPQEILTRHFAESLFGAQAAGICRGELLDIGSGAGFPALPIALLFREVHETLLEPNLKKAAFLAEACRTLELVGRVRIVKVRLEEFKGNRGSFDFITCRAVRVNEKFMSDAGRFLQTHGRFVLWLGQEGLEVLGESSEWDWSNPVQIPGSERRFVVWGSKRENRST